MTYNQKMDRLSFTALYVYFCITIDCKWKIMEQGLNR